jgi:hypothetical protein
LVRHQFPKDTTIKYIEVDAMKLVNEKYRKLKPQIEYLTDEAVIAQAWKKTHGYMRTHNWYADTLALDISALGLENNAKIWADGIKSGKIDLRKMELIPAAKSEPWTLHSKDGWRPLSESKARKKKPPVRPLAHLTIRDQTWATALMMCLADAVETAQGDCSRNPIGSKVFSYGNRLQCDWSEGQDAWFRWGNGETYRKFFTDYQNFLKRPIDVGIHAASTSSDADHVFVVNLDLSRFYDNIDRKKLIERLRNISDDYEGSEKCEKFWNTAVKIIDWEWEKDAVDVAKKIGIQLGGGLPQGLVASGFFANAYMISFDRAIGDHIGEVVPDADGVILHDYCRYVDDIRLVVSVDNFDADKLIGCINKWITKALKEYSGV